MNFSLGPREALLHHRALVIGSLQHSGYFSKHRPMSVFAWAYCEQGAVFAQKWSNSGLPFEFKSQHS